MKIIAFAGSSSIESINKKLATWTASLFEGYDTEVLDLNDFEIPIYSIDKEKANGIPEEIKAFSGKLAQADLIILSLAEHNGAYSAAFKNVFDWASRIPDTKVFQGKPLFLMATSPGGRGGATVLATAKNNLPHSGASIAATFSLPGFYDNFDAEKGITNEEFLAQMQSAVKDVLANIA